MSVGSFHPSSNEEECMEEEEDTKHPPLWKKISKEAYDNIGVQRTDTKRFHWKQKIQVLKACLKIQRKEKVAEKEKEIKTLEKWSYHKKEFAREKKTNKWK